MFNMRLKGSLADEIGKELEESSYKCGEDFDLVITSGDPVMVKWLRNDKVPNFYVKITLKCEYEIYNSWERSLGKYKTVSEFVKLKR